MKGNWRYDSNERNMSPLQPVKMVCSM